MNKIKAARYYYLKKNYLDTSLKCFSNVSAMSFVKYIAFISLF